MKIQRFIKNMVFAIVCGLFFTGLSGSLLSIRCAYASSKDEFGPGTGLAGGYGVYSPSGDAGNEEELKGVWISYLELEKLPKERESFQKAVDQMFDNAKSWGMNAVFVHVRSHSDAMYPSEYYPWSKFASGAAGKDPGYDPLDYMIKAAHARGLKFHAWLNPYRITGYLMSWDEVSDSSPAKQWFGNGDKAESRRVLNHNGAWYYNPSFPEVRELVTKGVAEIVENYQVDGIHFDDYFYPELNDDNPSRWFDLPEYLTSGSDLSIANWRRANVNRLVAETYHTVKSINPSVTFGISPQGYVEHLRSSQKLFADIDTWMSTEGYLDYIMPQIYWGFETRKADKTPAPYAFENNLKTWIDLKNRGNVKLYLGLAAYRAGTDTKDYNDISEWLRRDDILKRQVEMGRQSGQVSGYCFYSYSSFLEEAAEKEVKNLLPVLAR